MIGLIKYKSPSIDLSINCSNATISSLYKLNIVDSQDVNGLILAILNMSSDIYCKFENGTIFDSSKSELSELIEFIDNYITWNEYGDLVTSLLDQIKNLISPNSASSRDTILFNITCQIDSVLLNISELKYGFSEVNSIFLEKLLPTINLVTVAAEYYPDKVADLIHELYTGKLSHENYKQIIMTLSMSKLTQYVNQVRISHEIYDERNEKDNPENPDEATNEGFSLGTGKYENFKDKDNIVGDDTPAEYAGIQQHMIQTQQNAVNDEEYQEFVDKNIKKNRRHI